MHRMIQIERWGEWIGLGRGRSGGDEGKGDAAPARLSPTPTTSRLCPAEVRDMIDQSVMDDWVALVSRAYSREAFYLCRPQNHCRCEAAKKLAEDCPTSPAGT